MPVRRAKSSPMRKSRLPWMKKTGVIERSDCSASMAGSSPVVGWSSPIQYSNRSPRM